ELMGLRAPSDRFRVQRATDECGALRHVRIPRPAAPAVLNGRYKRSTLSGVGGLECGKDPSPEQPALLLQSSQPTTRASPRGWFRLTPLHVGNEPRQFRLGRPRTERMIDQAESLGCTRRDKSVVLQHIQGAMQADEPRQPHGDAVTGKLAAVEIIAAD